ncbi:hypothetical protein RB653_007372 [Dictyostelium firmibasis]|uniref:alpha-1,2-Mannosidase n=1 Tax=Dictyostelium firmibasis TaxID=79012 RepID=A0AAN7YR85_9MYCE
MTIRNKLIIAMFASIFIISSLTIFLFDGGINKNFNSSLPPKWKINVGKDVNAEYLNDKKTVEENLVNDDKINQKNNKNNHNTNHQNIIDNNNNNNKNNNNNNKNNNNNNNNNNKNKNNQHHTQNNQQHTQQQHTQNKKKENHNDNRHKLPRFNDESGNPFNKIDKVYKLNENKNKVRASKVREAMKHSWDEYSKVAWGHDELHPISNTYNDWFGMGLTIVDSLDTLYLMDLNEEYKNGRDWLAKELNQKKDTGLMISVFETVIRFLGQYCTVYDLTNDKIYKDKAKELGDLLLYSFPEGKPFPQTSINLANHRAASQPWMGGCVVLSEVGTIFLEFNHLSKITGDPKYKEYSDRVVDALANMKPSIPIHVSIDGQKFCSHRVSVGAMGDSYYEYLLKMWIYHDGREERYSKLFQESADAIIEHLYKVSAKGDGYITIMDYDVPTYTQEHLTCFAGGMFALAAVSNITGGNIEKDKLYMKVGEQVTKTCAKIYLTSATGLGPEIAHFNTNGDIEVNGRKAASHYILRPETVESLFILYRLTGDTIYQEWAWKIFESINSVCRTEKGFAGIKDVSNINSQYDDNQQSFFMAETLKYLYLIFQPSSVIPLDKYVFNTEAHPVKIQYE